MNVRRPSLLASRPQTTTTTNLFTASTAGWYARWKAGKDAPPPVPADEHAPAAEADAPAALARRLAPGAGKEPGAPAAGHHRVRVRRTGRPATGPNSTACSA